MELLKFLPISLRGGMGEEDLKNAEEIRLRAGHQLELLYADKDCRSFGTVSECELRECINYLSGYSPYAIEEELRSGYFTIEGGHRVGVSGHAGGGALYDISGINIRIAHEKKGCAAELIKHIRKDGALRSVLIFSPPGIGKTTLLRDGIRLLSTGDKLHPGIKVGVVDERSEIAACHLGVPQNDLGPRTDVLDNCPKAKGIMMLLRSMSPELIAADELGGAEDLAAFKECLKSGVAVLGTLHAGSKEEAREKFDEKGVVFAGIKRRADGTRGVEIYD